MKWLIVVPNTVPDHELATVFSNAQAQPLPNIDPVPLGADEVSYEVEGPDDLPHRLRATNIVNGVYPSSDLTLY